MIENITRHLEAGMTPMQATVLGAREIGSTVVTMSTSLTAVFIPILLMGGIVGRLFREFAVTLTVAILVSMLISLTVTPMLCSPFCARAGARHGRHTASANASSTCCSAPTISACPACCAISPSL